MHRIETKTVVLLLICLFFYLSGEQILATDFSSGSFTVKDPVIDAGQSSSTSSNFGLGQSVSQTAIGKSTSGSFQLWSGFQYFFQVNANVLTPTAGNAQVTLDWTVPTTYLGITVSGYEVGTGTVSGSYVFENVGSVTNFIKSGLTNGIPYYFIIKAKGPGGIFLVFSNEATATPTAGSGGGGGGGGGGSNYGTLNIRGDTSPNAMVTLNKDGQLAGTNLSDTNGSFNFNLSGLNPGSYAFSVFATDQDGNNTPSVNFSRTLQVGITDTVSDIILGPTIFLSHSEIKQGDMLNVSGFSLPLASVKLSILQSGSTNDFTIQSAANGFYTYSLDTKNMALGEYQAKTQATKLAKTTPESFILSFRVGEVSKEIEKKPCGRSDLNCDGRVNLIDFSILLYFWERTSFSLNPRVDIDHSGQVDLRDFSIMFYDWTG